MDIREYGEFELIERILSLHAVKLEEREVGIGDDCSVVEFDKNYDQITTTDLLIEDIHFFRDKIAPRDLGKKSLEVNVSDIAAMGGFPEVAYLSLAFPDNLKLRYFDTLMAGIKDTCNEYKIKLMGGDTTKSPGPIVINVLLQGKVEKNRLKLRSMAKPNDFVCIVGNIGDSGIGLKTLLGEISPENREFFITKHNNPKAYLKEARMLSTHQGVHAMIDISDGLAADLPHICRMSNVGAQIELSSLPLSGPAQQFFGQNNKDLIELALCSGEDYSILLTMSEKCYNEINSSFNGKFENKLTKIGHITSGLAITYLDRGIPVQNKFKGFEHF